MSTRISVIGTGYLGATHAAGMAELGFEVIGVDTDAAKVRALATGQVPFFEPGLPELLSKHVASGRLRFTTSLEEAARFADIHFVCVGTPQGANGAADLSYLHAVVDGLVPALERPALIVGKSTVPVGTAEALLDRIEALGAKDVELAWNPEFLREGHAVHDTLHPNRLVFGINAPGAEWALRKVYAAAIAEGSPVVVSNLPTAELVKVSANAFLATKISFINAMAELCELTGADVTSLADALGHDDRIGRKFLGAGLGYGGGCLPKDVRALVARAEELGSGRSVEFLHGVEAINGRRRDRVVDEALSVLRNVDGRAFGRVAVLGASFKPLSDDVRDSPALDVARRLHQAGAWVTVYDPQAAVPARSVAPELRYAANAVAACRKADVVLHLTDWAEFRDLDPARLRQAARGSVLIDARNTLDPEPWLAAGWDVRTLGTLVRQPAVGVPAKSLVG
ncbi:MULTISPECIES: UDP-glucose dehydrogenase family protein [unclassified Nocardioides]|uniref:UDP-glucose dehydrogenase family protein n=1 Tax=unclassified Nocardioides TaxID=2615069 RepID=UPI00070098A6|nr:MULTISPECIES: UDP-glucose/GDP-mannose dehydrogenase family protein [unclassified Nocardioides]KQY63837.1 UDP-glucose 6-dehydrogenase [Nocardioides sp. Root140]KQZ69756.1 UDP-glucose 6-dehydrogenase [Nocardioides sp. Root151]KRF15850.1 UDP-glucose 6-dehydrogenase [Nocardioides sp. Soil796]